MKFLTRAIGAAGLLIGLLLTNTSLAGEASSPEISQGLAKKILAKLESARPDLTFSENIKASVIAGLYQVQVEKGPLLYVTEDGGHLISGNLFEIQSDKLVNVWEREQTKVRSQRLADIDPSKEIIFSPQKKTKAHIYVFTDVDCGYCQKLHQDVPKLNELGIEVRYLAFPRAGLESESYDRIVTAWCSDNQRETLTKLKSLEAVDTEVCDDNPVTEQYQLGLDFQLQGTPAIVLENGTMVPGYVPPERLLEMLHPSEES